MWRRPRSSRACCRSSRKGLGPPSTIMLSPSQVSSMASPSFTSKIVHCRVCSISQSSGGCWDKNTCAQAMCGRHMAKAASMHRTHRFTRECKGILCSSIIAFIIMRPSGRVSGAQKGRPLLRPLPSALSGRRLRPLRCKAPDHRHSNTALRENVRRAVSSACTPAWKGPYLRYSRSSARAASTSRRSITSQALCT